MDELLDRLTASAGIDRAVAEKSVGIILDFLMKDGPTEQVKALIDKVPGAQAALEAQQAQAGMFSMPGLMGAGSRMMAAGLGMGQVQAVTREFIAFAREKAGEENVGAVVGAIPGLDQFV